MLFDELALDNLLGQQSLNIVDFSLKEFGLIRSSLTAILLLDYLRKESFELGIYGSRFHDIERSIDLLVL